MAVFIWQLPDQSTDKDVTKQQRHDETVQGFIKKIFYESFFIIIIITATVGNTQLGVKTKQFLIASSYKCQNPRHMEEEDKVVIGKCPWCKQNERSVILLCY